MSTISLTVKVPFAGNYPISAAADATARALCEQVASICPAVTGTASSQCIVYRGRVLPDTLTLSEAGVVDGAVLHLMRKPAPGRAAAAARNAARPPQENDDDEPGFSFSMFYGQFQPGGGDADAGPVVHVQGVSADPDVVDGELHPFQMYGMGHMHAHHHHHDGDDDDDGHDDDGHDEHLHDHDEHDHHHHDHEHPFNQYFHHHHEHDHEHDHGHDHGHDHDHSTHTHYFVFGQDDEAEPPQSGNGRNQTSVFYVHRNRDTMIRYVDAYDVVVYVLNALGYSANAGHHAALLAAAIAVASQSREERGHAGFTALENAWFEARRAQERITSAGASGDGDRPTVPRDMPDDEDAGAAGAAATQTLFPSLASMLRAVADRVENAQPASLVQESRREEANELVEQLGSLASTLSSTTALFSSLLPLQERERDSGTDQQGAVDQSGSDGTMGQDREGTSGSGSQQRGGQRNGVRMELDSTPGSSPNVTGNRGASRPTANVQRGTEAQSGTTERRTANFEARGLPEGIRLNNAPRTDQDRAANADFVLRILAYYMRSFSTSIAPNGIDPPTIEGQNADSVLDGVYGSGGRPVPADWGLRVIQQVMQSLTPQQFHSVVRGDVAALNSLPIDLWRSIGLHLFGENLSSDYDEEITEAFIDTVCDVLHTFSHEIEEVYNDMQRDGDDYLEDICAHTMPVLQHRVVELADLLKCHREDPGFADDLLELISMTWGELSHVLSRLLNVQWSGLLVLLRRASFEVGVRVVGERLAVMFPVIANLLSIQAKSVYERVGSNPENATRSRPRPAAHGHVRLPDERTRLQQSHRDMRNDSAAARGSEGGADHGMEELPDLVDEEESDWEDDESEWEDQDTESEVYEDSYDDDDEDDDHDNYGDDEGHATAYRPSHVKELSRESQIELDDHDMADLAAELDAEYTPTSRVDNERKAEEDSSLDELDEIARELEQEHSKRSAAPNASIEKPKRVAAAGVKRTAGMASALSSSSMGRPGLAAGLASSRVSNGTSFNRTAFSTTSVPRASLSASAVRPPDEFDAVLGPREGAKWRRVLREDEAKMLSSVWGPLSRGFRNDQSAVAPLTGDSATRLALEDARAAAREAQLSEQATEQLVNAVTENGPLYLQEFENALRSRLATDPDFHPDNFPAAAARFRPS